MDIPSPDSLLSMWTHLSGRMVDLTLDIYDGAPSSPGDPTPSVTVYDTIDRAGYNLTRLVLGSHQGTHLDAPYHFFDDGATVEELDLRHCVGPALLIDLSHKAPRATIDVSDLVPWAKSIVSGTRLVLRTDWDYVTGISDGRADAKDRRGMGNRPPGTADYFHDAPQITPRLAHWLVERGVVLLGMDMPSPSVHESDEVHRALLGAGIVVVEGLAYLRQIESDAFILIAAPLRLRGRDGSPIRAIGLVPDSLFAIAVTASTNDA